MWSRTSSQVTYENAWIRVREDAVVRPDGSAGIYKVVEVRHPAVFVVAVTADDEVVLVEVDRYPTGRSGLEVPAGGSDGEVSWWLPPVSCVRRPGSPPRTGGTSARSSR